ncbi:hypothetical protein, partial [Bacteroides heparinolyticus]|uniref:hypothetical protein n=1 Tax=Prevotella heparinolytica TaxID=28113 RepID=UPI0035A122D7
MKKPVIDVNCMNGGHDESYAEPVFFRCAYSGCRKKNGEGYAVPDKNLYLCHRALLSGLAQPLLLRECVRCTQCVCHAISQLYGFVFERNSETAKRS